MWTKEREEPELAMCVKSGAIWPKITRRDGRREE